MHWSLPSCGSSSSMGLEDRSTSPFFPVTPYTCPRDVWLRCTAPAPMAAATRVGAPSSSSLQGDLLPCSESWLPVQLLQLSPDLICNVASSPSVSTPLPQRTQFILYVLRCSQHGRFAICIRSPTSSLPPQGCRPTTAGMPVSSCATLPPPFCMKTDISHKLKECFIGKLPIIYFMEKTNQL